MKNLLLMVFFVALPASAGVYKWTDENGNVHFGDRPVDESKATEVTIHDNSNSGITNSSGNKKEREYLLKSIEEDKEKKAKKKKKRAVVDKKRKIRCDYYKRRYQSHIQSNRSFKISPDGERTYLNAEQRTAKLKKISKGVSKYCR